MSTRKASDLFVECLEAEGVGHVFGIPGEETLDLNESLSRSSIEFVPVRHEQGGAYMADVYGRLTGRAGVCLGTLGPGALNLVTAVADAYLDRAPLVALTGQGDLERMHKESHQYIDLLRVMRPITKWNARISDPAIIPEVVRKAFKLAEGEKPGATHIELPEDVMADEVDAEPLPRRQAARPEPAARELLKAADLVRGAINPVALAGNGVIRAGPPRRCASSCAPPASRWRKHRRGQTDQRLDAIAPDALLGRLAHAPPLSPLVKEEAGKGSLDHLLGHALRDLEVAGPHGDVVEGHDPHQLLAFDDRQPPDPVLDHQCRGLLEVHVGLAGDQRSRRVLAGGFRAWAVLGQGADRQVPVGDHRRRLAVGVAEHDGPDIVVAHQLGDPEYVGIQRGGDDAAGHDLAELHRPVP